MEYNLYTPPEDKGEKISVSDDDAPVYDPLTGLEKLYAYNVPHDVMAIPYFLDNNRKWNAAVHNVHTTNDWMFLCVKIALVQFMTKFQKRQILKRLASDIMHLRPQCNLLVRKMEELFAENSTFGENRAYQTPSAAYSTATCAAADIVDSLTTSDDGADVEDEEQEADEQGEVQQQQQQQQQQQKEDQDGNLIEVDNADSDVSVEIAEDSHDVVDTPSWASKING